MILDNVLKEITLWDELEDFVRFTTDLWRPYPDFIPDEVMEKWREYYNERVLSKEEFLARLENYAVNGRPNWQNQAAQSCDMLYRESMQKALENGTYANGEKRYKIYKKMEAQWAFHLKDYSQVVNDRDGQFILELTVGAGLGTCAIIENLKPNSRVFCVEIDFACAKTADGIARFFDVTNRVCGINANFWALPFEDSTFDCVCMHYGQDEIREMPTWLKETARVIKPGGRFVGIARKNPWDYHRKTLELFGITQAECNPLLKKVRLYNGFENLTECATKYGLLLVEHKMYEKGHHRILYVFSKTQNV